MGTDTNPPARGRHRHGRRQADLRHGLALRRHRHGLLPSTRRAPWPVRCWTPLCCTMSSPHDPLDSTRCRTPRDMASVVRAAQKDLTGLRVGVISEPTAERATTDGLATPPWSARGGRRAGGRPSPCPHLGTRWAPATSSRRGLLQPGPLRRCALRPAGRTGVRDRSPRDRHGGPRAGFGDEVKRRISRHPCCRPYYDAPATLGPEGALSCSATSPPRDKADILVSPTAPVTAYRFGGPLAMLRWTRSRPTSRGTRHRPALGAEVMTGFRWASILAPQRADDRLYAWVRPWEARAGGNMGAPLLSRASWKETR